MNGSGMVSGLSRMLFRYTTILTLAAVIIAPAWRILFASRLPADVLAPRMLAALFLALSVSLALTHWAFGAPQPRPARVAEPEADSRRRDQEEDSG